MFPPRAQALKLVPEGHPERLNLLSNRAAAYLQLRQFADVVEECSTILKTAPDHAKALARRAKAYDATAQYGKALKDLDALVASSGDAGEDMSGLHDRVRALVADPSLANKQLNALPSLPLRSGGAPASNSQLAAQAAAAAAAQQQQQQLQSRVQVQWVKAQLGDDIRLVAFALEEGLQGLKNAVAKKWAEETVPLVVKSVPPPAGGHSAASETIVSPEHLLSSLSAWSAAGRMPRVRLVRPGEDGEPPFDNGLLDEWILDFAGLVREHLGIDAESHLDLQNQGVELYTAALAETTPPELAAPQFESAEAKLREAAAFALFNWGNVHMCMARKRMEGPKQPKPAPGETPKPAPPPPVPSDETVAAVESLFEQAEQRFLKALEVKSDMHDVRISLAQHRYERARLLASIPGRSDEAEAQFQEASTRFRDVIPLLPDDIPAAKPAPATEDSAADAKPTGEAVVDPVAAPGEAAEHSQRAQVYVMWGNVLYEHSQARVRTGRSDWQPVLDEAVAHFKTAGCLQSDIDAALAIHASKA